MNQEAMLVKMTKLKSIDLASIDECIMHINNDYPDHVCFTFDEFKDVFSHALEPHTR